MNWFPLYNSLRIAAVSTVVVVVLAVLAAYYVTRLRTVPRALLDMLLLLPLMLPPTVTGWALLMIVGPKHPIGVLWELIFGRPFVRTWFSGVLAAIVVTFPIMYRSARAAFDGFDEDLADAGRTLGRSEMWIFWNIRVNSCRHGLVAGVVLAFTRALGEYGATVMVAGYRPGLTATISTTVFDMWYRGDHLNALRWALVNMGISVVFLFLLFLVENRGNRGRRI